MYGAYPFFPPTRALAELLVLGIGIAPLADIFGRLVSQIPD